MVCGPSWRAIVINYQSGDHTSTSTWMNIYLYIHTQCCSTYHEFDYREKGDIEMLHAIFFVSLLLLRLYPCSLPDLRIVSIHNTYKEYQI